MALKPVIVPAAVKQTATIIFLHGLGDSGNGWSEILQVLRPAYAKILCPNAQERPVTLNGGFRMQAWFDMRPLDQPKDIDGIRESADMIKSLIQNEVNNGIPTSRIVLGGFSQGGALALYAGLQGSVLLPGILALSTWLPIDKNIAWDKIHKPKILQCHGDEDNMVSIDRARKTAKILKTHIPSYQFKTYSGLDHTVNNEEELKDIKNFLIETIPSLQTTSKL